MPVPFILDLVVALCSMIMSLMLMLSTMLYITREKTTREHHNSAENNNEKPMISIIVPICNEDPLLVESLLEHLSKLEWPRDRLEVLIVDDSEEELYRKIREVAERQAEKLELNVRVLRRGTRKGYKAGALNYALKHASGEYISVLDVDIKPRRDYLHALYSYVEKGFDYAQGLTEFKPVINTLTSIIAKFQEEYLNNTVYKFYTRNVFLRGHTFLIKKKVLEEIGGFNESTGKLTEDVELTVRLRLRGFRGVLVPEVLSEGLVAMTYGCYLLQRARWVTGSLLVLLKYFPKVMSSRALAFRDKLEIIHSLLTRTSSLAFLLCALAPLVYYGFALSMSDVVFNVLLFTYIIALLYLCISSRRGSSGSMSMLSMIKAVASSLLWISTAPFILMYLLTGGRWYVTPKTLRQIRMRRPIMGVVYSAIMLVIAALSVFATISSGLLILLPVSGYLLLSLMFSIVLSISDLVKVYRSRSEP